MADIFISYQSSDRPRAEELRSWFEELGWSVWLDREMDIGEGWEQRIEKELRDASLVVVLWGAQAGRSEYVMREAHTALHDGRLLQIHATGLPLLPPFDEIQAVRMQSWFGEAAHSEKAHLLAAVAARLRPNSPTTNKIAEVDKKLPGLNYNLVVPLELAFHYCARQLEWRRHQIAGDLEEQGLEEIRDSFIGLLEHLKAEKSSSMDDPEGILHQMVEDFLDQLELLVLTCRNFRNVV